MKWNVKEEFIKEGNTLIIKDLKVEVTKEDQIKKSKDVVLENLCLLIENNPESGYTTLDFFREKCQIDYFKKERSIFTIRISNGNVSPSRAARRPNHDHDDVERVYVDKKTTELMWLSSGDKKTMREVKISFGDIIREN